MPFYKIILILTLTLAPVMGQANLLALLRSQGSHVRHSNRYEVLLENFSLGHQNYIVGVIHPRLYPGTGYKDLVHAPGAQVLNVGAPDSALNFSVDEFAESTLRAVDQAALQGEAEAGYSQSMIDDLARAEPMIDGKSSVVFVAEIKEGKDFRGIAAEDVRAAIRFRRLGDRNSPPEERLFAFEKRLGGRELIQIPDSVEENQKPYVSWGPGFKSITVFRGAAIGAVLEIKSLVMPKEKTESGIKRAKDWLLMLFQVAESSGVAHIGNRTTTGSSLWIKHLEVKDGEEARRMIQDLPVMPGPVQASIPIPLAKLLAAAQQEEYSVARWIFPSKYILSTSSQSRFDLFTAMGFHPLGSVADPLAEGGLTHIFEISRQGYFDLLDTRLIRRPGYKLLSRIQSNRNFDPTAFAIRAHQHGLRP